MRFIFYIVCYFLNASSLNDLKKFVFFSYTALCWLLVSVLSRFAFSNLTGRYFDDGNVEISPPATAKVEMFLLLFMINFISQAFGSVSINIFRLHFQKDWMFDEMKEDEGKRNFKYIFLTGLKLEMIVNVTFWFLFSVIIGIVSVQYISNLDANVEILFFGYLFPVLKASIVTVINWFVRWCANTQGWSLEYSAKMASVFSGVAVQLWYSFFIF